MIKFSRDDFKIDKVAAHLFDTVKRNHKPANHTERILLKNKHVKDFCEEATHYSQYKLGDRIIYISYEVSSWFKKPMGVQLRIDSITLYDDFIEYTKAKMKGLNSVGLGHADNPNLN